MSQRSGFSAGFLSLLTQPFFCQPYTQPLLSASMTYLESEYSSTSHGSFKRRRASMTAVSSMRLLVVCASPPESSRSCAPYLSTAPQPPGPGLPLHAPSV